MNRDNTTTNCLITGVGGQGTILAARLIGAAAMRRGLDVRGSETIGMAQRGGSVASHVRLGHDIRSPLIPPGKADLILAFEPGEAARASDYLAPDGLMLVCDRAVRPSVPRDTGGDRTVTGYSAENAVRWLQANMRRLIVLDGGDIIARCGARCLNVALIGAALVLGALPFDARDIEAALRARLNPRHIDMNLAALRYGLSVVSVGNDPCVVPHRSV